MVIVYFKSLLSGMLSNVYLDVDKFWESSWESWNKGGIMSIYEENIDSWEWFNWLGKDRYDPTVSVIW
jgi:hypothetical protein